MIKIILKIDFRQDTKNWARISQWQKYPYGLKKRMKKIKLHLIKDFSQKELAELKKSKVKLEKFFRQEGQIFFKVLEKITAKPIYTKKFHASFTSAGFRPYDIKSNWFMIPATENFSRQITDICHELLHLQVSHYYKERCIRNGLTEKQFSELNEALAFLFNDPLFEKFDLLPDEGYPNEQKIRKELKKIWEKQKDFDKLIDTAISKSKLQEPVKC